MKSDITIIGAGLAGSEAALTLAAQGVNVLLIEGKPIARSPAHNSDDFCELVCSNSLKSLDSHTAHGLLKAELRELNSYVLSAAEQCAVPAGSALAVDRTAFAKEVTKRILSNDKITVQHSVAGDIGEGLTIIATGPLTLAPLDEKISELFGSLHFYDAEAPIISAESVDMDSAYYAARYGKGNADDYLNCPMTKDEYEAFYAELISAERADKHKFEKGEIFEGCMPVEVMASRGKDVLRFGPMKPVGLTDPRDGKRAYAVLQLRKENAAGDMYNLVGFQTNLKFAEQRRVFGMIPALKNAEFLRFGVMHRNTFIDAPRVIDKCFRSKQNRNIFVAGQLSGVEGYVESIASGKAAARHAFEVLNGREPQPFPTDCMLGALSMYISSENGNFQPMNANYGLLSPIEPHVRDKTERKRAMLERSLDALKNYLEAF